MTTQPDTSHQRDAHPSADPAPARRPPAGEPNTAPRESSLPGVRPRTGEPGRPFLHRVRRGRPEDPRWVRPAFVGLLVATGLLYLYDLSASGYANSFYSAAVQAGSQSWKAFFFGSLDSANAITVDKPPASLWPMALSVRIFGLGSWAILVPQVLMGVATVGVLYAAVRRRFSPAAGLIAGAVCALTPVAALMFRFNNPDAMLALLMTVTVYCVLRGLEDGRTKWLVWAGVAVGFAFLAKTLQAFLILPPLAVLYAVCAPVGLRKRFAQIGLSAGAVLVAGGWWVAIVELWPASSRPYIGGSQNNSFLELTFGYNGLGRISGDETGSVGGGGGGGGGTGRWGETGWDRMFNSEIGGQISWLLPAALILLVAGIVLTRKAGRTDLTRGSFLAWGGSLLMTMAVFSYMAGIFHQYYTVALAPYIAAVVGMGATMLWEERGRVWASLTLAGAVTASAAWGYVLLNRTSDYLPWLKWLVLVGGLTGALGLIFVTRLGRHLALATAGLGFVAAVAGPTAYTLSTVNTGHSGSIVTAGPSGASVMGGPGGGGGMRGGFPGGAPNQRNGNGTQQNGQQGGGAGAPPTGGTGGFPGRNQQGNGNPQGNNGAQGRNQGGGMPGGGTGGGGMGAGRGAGGLLNGASVGSAARTLLSKDADDYTWAAAAIGSQNSASYQLATGKPVMAIGGFNGTDPSPTLAQFKKYVTDGRIHYFISGGGMGGGGMGGGGASGTTSTSSRISSWVTANFKKVTVGSATFYDLTQPTS
ncbi:glycosyltransferase family 39 protein [Streptomyces sp. NPDC006333]|uniref:ArnT family glycosyltransferase n=1 Tax=unclassified Streptomyces TaxID=2593676 RepID=UPI0033B95BF4